MSPHCQLHLSRAVLALASTQPLLAAVASPASLLLQPFSGFLQRHHTQQQQHTSCVHQHVHHTGRQQQQHYEELPATPESAQSQLSTQWRHLEQLHRHRLSAHTCSSSSLWPAQTDSLCSHNRSASKCAVTVAPGSSNVLRLATPHFSQLPGSCNSWLQHTAGFSSQSISSSGGADSTSSTKTSNTTTTTSNSGSTSTSSSASADSWVVRYLPAGCVPYAHLMRLDKPIGSWLLAWPGLWSIGLAAAPGHLPDPWLTALFGLGAVLMRGAGCTINDLWDRDIDRQVERTRSRPLAAGTVTPLAALLFLGAQLSASLAILLQLNTYTQVLGVCSLGLVATYPLMKRVTWWPQAFLGLAMNYGVLMGYSAAAGACDWAVVAPMYAAGVSWTLIYDTIYAHQDKRDDALVGVKSTALLFGDSTKTWSAGFAVAQALGMVLAGQAAGCGLPFYAGVAAGSAHVAWQIRSVDLHSSPDCMAKFVSNKWYGALIYGGIVLDRLLGL